MYVPISDGKKTNPLDLPLNVGPVTPQTAHSPAAQPNIANFSSFQLTI